MIGRGEQTILVHLSKYLSRIDTSWQYVAGFDMSHWVGHPSLIFSILEKAILRAQTVQARTLDAGIIRNLKELEYGG
jgi:hypothetical protein